MTGGSLRVRLLLAAGLFIALALALAAFGLTLMFKRHVEGWIEGELIAHMDQLIAGLDQGADGALHVARLPGDPRFGRPLSGLYWEAAVEPDGPVLRSRSLWDFVIALPPEAQVDDALRRYSVTGPGGASLYLVQRRVELPERLGRKPMRVAVAVDAAQVHAAVWRFASVLVPFLMLIASLLAAGAWAQVSVGLRPLAAVRARLAGIGSGAQRRLGVGFPDEVQPLASEIDALLADREQQIERARNRAADLAHGLKTPLQVLAGEADRLSHRGEGDASATLRDIAATMSRHVERELARSRSAAAANAACDVAQAATSVAGVVKRTPAGAKLGWTLEVPPGLTAKIAADDLAEALGNLVENAARYAASEVIVQAHRQGAVIHICVSDDGPGIPRSRLKEALRRGGRLDTADDQGNGLGLAIVADIAETWGATLSFSEPTRNEPEGRFAITLTVPAAGP